MRVYKQEKLKEIYCNKCGRKIQIENEIVKEGVMSVDYKWEYFSKKDGMKHSFDLCEACYDKMIKNFLYPVSETEYSELL